MSCYGSAFRDQTRHRPSVQEAQPHTQRHLHCDLNDTGISRSSKNENYCRLWLPHDSLCISWECESQIWGAEGASTPPASERAGRKEAGLAPAGNGPPCLKDKLPAAGPMDPGHLLCFPSRPVVSVPGFIASCWLGAAFNTVNYLWPIQPRGRRPGGHALRFLGPKHQHIRSLNPLGFFAPRTRHTPSLPSSSVTSVLVQK